MENDKKAIMVAVESLQESNASAPDFRKTQALEFLGQALHALNLRVDQIPHGKPVSE